MFGISPAYWVIIEKAIASVALLIVAFALERFLWRVVRSRVSDGEHRHTLYMLFRNSVYLLAIALILAIWFGLGSGFSVAVGIIGAGFAFASQQVILSFVGYLYVVAGSTYHIGDRVNLGNVAGDVMDIGVLRTTLMEIGEWVHAEQYTGRVVTVANAAVFSAPVYNYTEHWPYLWDEIMLPVTYESDWRRAEEIMLDHAKRYTSDSAPDAGHRLVAMRRRYPLAETPTDPALYVSMTDNWIELTLRYVVGARVRRQVRTLLQRELLEAFEKEPRITVASATFEVVGLPPLRFTRDDAHDALRPSG